MWLFAFPFLLGVQSNNDPDTYRLSQCNLDVNRVQLSLLLQYIQYTKNTGSLLCATYLCKTFSLI